MIDNKTAYAAFDLNAKRNVVKDKVLGGDDRQDAASTFAMARTVIRDAHKAQRIIELLMLILVVSVVLNAAILVMIL
jgi:hypothetical protein